MKELKNQLFEVIEDLCLIPVQSGEQTLMDDLNFDSLRLVMLLVTLEDTFEIELDESDMNPFALVTVNDVIALVEKYVATDTEDDGDE